MNNGAKVIVGSMLGASVGYVISKVMEREVEQPAGLRSEPKETFRERWERAKIAGEEARIAKEAELRAYFREKVNDPTALRPTPTATEPREPALEIRAPVEPPVTARRPSS